MLLGLGAVVLAAIVGAVGLVASVRPAPRAELAYNPYNLVRLHVLAASDRPEDQALKMRARDTVVNFLSSRWGEVRDTQGALAVLEANRVELARLLGDLIAAAGKDYGVILQVGYFPFPERTYRDLTLPAGTYPALRVILGEGTGQNWWCVLFPPLCFLDARVAVPTALPLSAEEAVLSFAMAQDGQQAMGAARLEAGQVPHEVRQLLVGRSQSGGMAMPRPEVRLFILDWMRRRGIDPAGWVQRWWQEQAHP
ncbi:MAG: stage II sporulation protein R [Bacillota bacterium]